MTNPFRDIGKDDVQFIDCRFELGECALCHEPAVTEMPMNLTKIVKGQELDVIEVVPLCEVHAAEEKPAR